MKPVLYLRMSSAAQEASIPEQRKSLHQFAAEHGAHIVGEYADEAISGDATERRLGFQKMIADSAFGKWDTILCWDQDRFGRFNSIEAGFWIFPLMKAGIQLVTLAQGKIDWNDFTGRMMYAIQQEGKHEFLRSVSRNVSRGQYASALKGNRVGARAPYGYRTENQRLVVESEHAAIVRKIYGWYGEGDSLRAVAIRLNDMGILAPKGGAWLPVTIRLILTHRVYLGEFSWNAKQGGKYNRIRDGKVQATGQGEEESSNPEDQVIICNNHEAIIEPSVFDDIQSRLGGRQKRTTPTRGGGGFLLTSLLTCATCGYSLTGNTSGAPWRLKYYGCSHARLSGKAACPSLSVRQDLLVKAFNDAIGSRIVPLLDPVAIRTEIERQLQDAENRESTPDVSAKLAAIEKRIAAAKRRVVEVDADMLDVAQEYLRNLILEQRRLKTLSDSGSRKARKGVNIKAIVQQAMKEFQTAWSTIEGGNPDSLREFYADVISGVKLWLPTVKTRIVIPDKAFLTLQHDSKLVQYVGTCSTSSAWISGIKLHRRDFIRAS